MPAERRKLETLYDRLNDAYNQNSTLKLKKDLDLKYRELREIQQKIELGTKNYEEELRIEYTQNLRKSSEQLELKQSQLKKSIKSWKDDIIEREKNLKKLKDKLNQTMKKQLKVMEGREKLLEKEKERLKLKQQELKEISKKLTERLSETRQIELQYQENFKSEENKWKKSLNSASEKLKRTQEKFNKKDLSYRQNLSSLKMKLDYELTGYKKNLLKQLKEEMALEIEKDSKILANYFREGNELMITKMLNSLTKQNEQLGNALKAKLGKIGRSEEWFLKRFHENTSDS